MHLLYIVLLAALGQHVGCERRNIELNKIRYMNIVSSSGSPQDMGLPHCFDGLWPCCSSNLELST